MEHLPVLLQLSFNITSPSNTEWKSFVCPPGWASSIDCHCLWLALVDVNKMLTQASALMFPFTINHRSTRSLQHIMVIGSASGSHASPACTNGEGIEQKNALQNAMLMHKKKRQFPSTVWVRQLSPSMQMKHVYQQDCTGLWESPTLL